MSIKSSGAGFTLLELLIAMTLMAVVTLIASMALRLTVQAWERGSQEGESRQIMSALPSLLEKQLSARITSRIFNQSNINPDHFFCGSEESLSFLTTFAPYGSAIQGVIWVRYEYEKDQNMLLIYMQPITRLDDLNIGRDGSGSRKGFPVSNKLSESLPVGQIHGIADFRISYAEKPVYETDDSGKWETEWKCGLESVGLPSGLMLEIIISEGSRDRSLKWFYLISGIKP